MEGYERSCSAKMGSRMDPGCKFLEIFRKKIIKKGKNLEKRAIKIRFIKVKL